MGGMRWVTARGMRHEDEGLRGGGGSFQASGPPEAPHGTAACCVMCGQRCGVKVER